jgi:hypothetical protein
MKTQKDALEPPTNKKCEQDFLVKNDFSFPISHRFLPPGNFTYSPKLRFLPPGNFTNSPKVCEIDWSDNIFLFLFFFGQIP